MPILNRKSFNSEGNRLSVNSLFLECSHVLREITVGISKSAHQGRWSEQELLKLAV